MSDSDTRLPLRIATPALLLRRLGRQDQARFPGRHGDLDRSQGEGGLFVPDAGHPFGELPDWLIRRRSKVPDWAKWYVDKLHRR